MTTVLFRQQNAKQASLVEADIDVGAVQIEGALQSVIDCKPDIPFTGRVYGVLFNYQDALNEAQAILADPPYEGAPTESVFYFKLPNTLSSFGAPIVLPKGVESLCINACIGVVIGTFASRLTLENAMDHVLGYTIVCDVNIPSTDFYRHPLKQRCHDGFCPVGPWIVPTAALSAPESLAFRIKINDSIQYASTSANMLRSIAKLLVELTEFMSLCPGDVLLTGTHGKAPLARAGDNVCVEVDGIGSLKNSIVVGDI